MKEIEITIKEESLVINYSVDLTNLKARISSVTRSKHFETECKFHELPCYVVAAVQIMVGEIE